MPVTKTVTHLDLIIQFSAHKRISVHQSLAVTWLIIHQCWELLDQAE